MAKTAGCGRQKRVKWREEILRPQSKPIGKHCLISEKKIGQLKIDKHTHWLQIVQGLSLILS